MKPYSVCFGIGFLLSLGLSSASSANAQCSRPYIVISSAISYNATTNKVTGVSQTSMDYNTTSLYVARTIGYIYNQNPSQRLTTRK